MGMKSLPRVLVTGHKGFLGSHMVRFMRERGYPLVTCATCDYQVVEDVDRMVAQADWIIHLAATMGGVGYFTTYQFDPFVHNMRIDMNILESARKHNIKRIFYASSACIYPQGKMNTPSATHQFRETDILPGDPDQLYGWQKLMGLLLCQKSGIDCRIGIIHTIYGEGQDDTGEYAKVIPSLMRKGIEAKKTGHPLELWGDGSQERTFLHVDDFLEKMVRVLEHPQNLTPINIGSDHLVSIRALAELVCEVVGIEPHFTFRTDKPTGGISRGCDNSAFLRYFNYRDRVDLREGIRRMFAYMTEGV